MLSPVQFSHMTQMRLPLHIENELQGLIKRINRTVSKIIFWEKQLGCHADTYLDSSQGLSLAELINAHSIRKKS